MSRKILIKKWLCDIFNIPNIDITIASADASFRRYFRCQHQGKSFVIMDAPLEQESLEPFNSLGNMFRLHGVNNPKIYNKNEKHGFLLLQDFGDVNLLDKVNQNNADQLYHLAIDELIKIQTAPIDNIPIYNKTTLLQEMQLFEQWYLQRHLGIKLNTKDSNLLQDLFQILANCALEQPQVLVHRDYHSRNLMIINQQNIGIIDFQDALVGAISYDLVSLLKDCYIEWDDKTTMKWLKYYCDNCSLVEQFCDFNQLIVWFDWIGMQRHLKVAGIFARLNYRDNKKQYLSDIPLTVKYLRQVSSKYPELNLSFLEKYQAL